MKLTIRRAEKIALLIVAIIAVVLVVGMKIFLHYFPDAGGVMGITPN